MEKAQCLNSKDGNNFQPTLLSQAIQNPESINETDKILVDDDIQTKSKGLFPKTMNGKSFLALIGHEADLSNITLLRQAQINFINSWVANPTNPTIFPLSLPSDDLANALYSEQTNNQMNLSKKIYLDTAAKLYKSLNTKFSSKLSNWITLDELKHLYIDSLKELMNESETFVENKYFVPKHIEDGLNELHGLISNRKVKVHYGHAGCGKSTSVVNECTKDKKCVIVSLSNTICNMFKQKVNHIQTCSCSKANILFAKNKEDIFTNADIIVIDEFSQWGFEWLPLLNNILKCNPNADFYIMGDVDQIPTFLSSGSLLYSIINEFPNKVEEHKTQYRFANVPEYRDLVNDILNNQLKPNLVIGELNDFVLKNTDCFICGTRDNVSFVNKRALCARFPDKINFNSTFTNKFNILQITDGEVPLIATTTTKIRGANVYRNTRYKVNSIQDDEVILKSQVDGSLVLCKEMDININFDFAYAITVNKAQGLEWENVCCYITSSDWNLKSYNALYVALTRGKHNIIIASDGHVDDSNRMSVKDLQNILNIKYKFYNNFNE
jgi:hypothetical protein